MSWQTSISQSGAYVRKDSAFRFQVSSQPDALFKPEKNRYVLIVSLACPWACRTLIVRKIKQLEHVIDVIHVDWLLIPGQGWKLSDQQPECSSSTPFFHSLGYTHLKQVYLQSDPEYKANITVPVLYDQVNQVIVNNESSEIIRMLNSQFNHLCATPEAAAIDLYPNQYQSQIDQINSWIYTSINNGVYKCGFAQSQQAYETAFDELFAALDRVEDILAKSRYLTGSYITEADIRLFTTLIRFDPVYLVHFKCNQSRIKDYPNISNYVKELFSMPAFRDTTDWIHIKHHYFESHRQINPFGVVPKGPGMDWLYQSHDRQRDELPSLEFYRAESS